MTSQELFNAIVENFDDLQRDLSWGEFFFEIGTDGSSFHEEIGIVKIMRNPHFKRTLRESGIDFYVDRNGKINFVEVTNERA